MDRGKLLIVISFILILIIWIVWTNINITTNNLEIKNKKIPVAFNGFKIAQVSDFHNHKWGNKLIEKIKKEKPDIIAITGDFVDSYNTDFDIAMEFIKEANEIASIYYVTGNHEVRIENYNILKEKLENANVNMMDDRAEFIERDNRKIQILGIEDPDFVKRNNEHGIQGEITNTKLKEILDKDYFNLLLSHRPEQFEQYVKGGVNLVLTGHAHGGQVRIPFIGGILAPNQGLLPKYTEGIYSRKNTDMVVSRGLGNSIAPIRINNTPELVIVTLKAK